MLLVLAVDFRKPEVWVIDSAVGRRNVVTRDLYSLGYFAYPMNQDIIFSAERFKK